jgi:hypothetical protein
VATPPSSKEIHAAVERAAESRRARYRQDPQYANARNLAERVDGMPGRPEPGQHDWWKIGWVVDAIAGREYDVWYRPRRLRVIERTRPEPVPVRDASQVPRIYRAQFGWVDRETGQYVPEPKEPQPKEPPA